jgi:predicted dehydrogenase
VGLLAVQVLRAAGCRVIGVDFDAERLDIAREFGATPVLASDSSIRKVKQITNDLGVDGVLIATATGDNGPIRQAARMARSGGRIVLVGTSGLNFSRQEWFEKELTFQVSRSYGPGRYDTKYELAGSDYPIECVRWTAKRNISAFIGLIEDGRVDVPRLISSRIDFSHAERAYELLTNDKNQLAIVLDYGSTSKDADERTDIKIDKIESRSIVTNDDAVFDVIGAGNYGSRVLIPALRRTGARLGTLVTAGGSNAAHFGRKFKFEEASSDVDNIFANNNSAVFVLTQHDNHAKFAQRAVEAGKAVYVEKPIAINWRQFEAFHNACACGGDSYKQRVMIGFNRRFAPSIIRMKELLDRRTESANFVYLVNAGLLPKDHWILDSRMGGGRLVSEVCHFIDLIRHLSGVPIAEASVLSPKRPGRQGMEQSVSVGLRMTDGSLAIIHYLANGPRSFPKERLEVFCAGSALKLDNFRSLQCFDWKGAHGMRLLRQDKGHQASIAAFVAAVRDGAPVPIPYAEAMEASYVSLLLNDRWMSSQSGWSTVEAIE